MVYFWYDNKELTQMNHSQQLPALHKQLIDGFNQNWQWQNDWTTDNLTNNKQLLNCDRRQIKMYQ